ncbi:MAG: hypothetical protein ACRELD_06550 [Longimicrobiales bacterium]
MRNWPASRSRLFRARSLAAAAALALLLSGCVDAGDVFGIGGGIEVLHPEDGERLYGVTTLRARVRDNRYHPEDYRMFWYVDDSREYEMYDEWDTRTPHKVDVVDARYWNWRGRGPYTVGFIAEDWRGRRIAERRIRVYVD